jgi:ParB family chromosome partitioning protein
VRQTEQLVRDLNQPRPERSRATPETDAHVEALAAAVRRSLGTKVTVNRSTTGAGTLTLHFFSDEEFDSILDRLLGAERPPVG